MDWKHACLVILKNVSKKELPDPIFKCIAIKFYESFKHFETLNEQNRAWPTLSNIPSENSSTKRHYTAYKGSKLDQYFHTKL